jgi:hypothetical protein
MEYAIEMGLGAVMYIPSFMKIGSAVQKLMGGCTVAQRAWRSHKPTFVFFKIRELC